MLRSLLIACALACASTSAMAQADVSFFQESWNVTARSLGFQAAPRRGVRAWRGSYGTVIGGRPAGCPAAYCGCASARYVGLRGSQWNLAANWLRLPRAAPVPGMAAARRGHVKIITAVLGNGRYRFYDPNSGGGLTRITTGTLAGYAVVNPRGRS